jgi:hypothetical protein
MEKTIRFLAEGKPRHRMRSTTSATPVRSLPMKTRGQ